jgi:UDP-N-acetylmuramate dehydrogenase
MHLPALAGVALRHELAGLSFGVAIPATLGGAVRMNAGAHGHEMADVVEHVKVFHLDTGESATVPAPEIGFSYRSSVLPPDAVVVVVTVHLASGEAAEIRAAMDEAREWRRRTQPLAEPNCGSVFKNPSDGPAAAQLIEEAGAKGLREGGASVSTKHANFIVAAEGARASDVVALIDRVQERGTGIRLEPEVRLIGGGAHVGA